MEAMCEFKELTVTCLMLYMSEKCKNGGRTKIAALTSRYEAAKDDQLLFVPYNPGNHWVLLVIHPATLVVYYLDSLKSNGRNKDIETIVETALKIHETNKRVSKRRTPSWNEVKCPQQSGSMECGFYVMKYMREFIRDQSILGKENVMFNLKKAFTHAELAEVRVEWINFVKTICGPALAG